jgi:hypothetical protein
VQAPAQDPVPEGPAESTEKKPKVGKKKVGTQLAATYGKISNYGAGSC